MQFMIAGAMVNGALYIMGVFFAGFGLGNYLAVKLAIATAGLAYISYLSNVAFLSGYIPPSVTRVIFVASVAMGAAGGIALLF